MIIEIPDSLLSSLQDLQSDGGYKNTDEMVMTALSVLTWVHAEHLKGKSVGSISADKTSFSELVPLTAPSVRRWLRRNQ